jgi:asparagine synthase (glutamine-hydrolysing)
MCGIAGYLSRRNVSTGLVEAMTSRLAHRGPDASAIALFASATGSAWRSFDGTAAPTEADVALGHRRLSIIDLSERGRQPMTNARADAWIIFNGEIYNYIELRAELIARGHAFATATDTEVILAAYREWGHAALHKLNGMFAFAIWDARAGELFCARDRLGVKPFYYWADDDTFVFGSEIKALFAHPAVPRVPNGGVIHDYLAFKQCDHTNETFFAGVLPLPAGHYLVAKPGRGFTLQRWWDVAVNDEVDDEAETRDRRIAEFHELLQDAIRIRLRSDVPVGTCLSGGLDSSSIAIIANKLIFNEHAIDHSLIGDHQKTFSACFDDARFDERAFIRLVLGVTGADSYLIFPSVDGLWRDLDRLLWFMDEPFQSTSQYSQHCVMRRVGEAGVKVTLDGQGADELLAGYPAYNATLLSTLIARGKLASTTHEARAILAMGGRGRSVAQLLLRVGFGLLPFGASVRRILAPLTRVAPESRLGAVIRPEFAARFSARRAEQLEQQAANLRDFPRRLYHDVFHNSLPALLRYEDRNSMAFSIEARTPFLDYRLVEHAFSLPMSHKIRDGWTKRVLRDAMPALPDEIRWRKDKKGFVTPEALWLRHGRERVRDTLGGRLAASEFLDAEAVTRGLDRALDTTDEGAFYTDVFRWFLLETWMRSAFDRS